MNFVAKLKQVLSQWSNRNDEVSQPHPLPVDTSKPIKLGMLVLLLGFGGFLLWMFTADLDEGVPVSGSIVVDSRRKVIQHPTGGVIKKIDVSDGQKVKAGAVLLQLIDTQARADVDVIQKQLDYFRGQISAIRPMADQGFYPQNQFLDLLRQADELTIKLKVAQENLERTVIRSPVDGVVMGVSVTTISGVIAPGVKLMEVVPEGDRLVIEAFIPINLIDKVAPTLEAEVHLSALNQRTTPVLMGEVIWVSPDKQQDPNRPEVAYYLARIKISDASLEKINNQTLVPGMPADVVIKTGSRTFWNYLVKPIVDRAALSLKER